MPHGSKGAVKKRKEKRAAKRREEIKKSQAPKSKKGAK